MSRHKIARTFIRSFVKIFSYSCLFFFVGYCSFKITTAVSGGAKNTVTAGEVTAQESIAEATVDRAANHIIFGVNQETAEVEHVLLEIFNVDSKNIDLVTIPVSSQFTMSKELYEKVSKINANIPQIITLSNFTEYFDQSVAYEYGILMLEEVLNTDISFYTAMLSDQFCKYFTQETTEDGTGTYHFTQTALQKLEQLTTEEEVLEEMTSYYKTIQSNLTLSRRQGYITYYLNGNYKYIYSHLILGSMQQSSYVIQSQAASKQLQNILNRTEMYRTEQNEEMEDTQQAQLHIFNGSGIVGLAASFEKTLKEEGFEIAEIGNYTTDSITQTKIQVNEEGMGTSLLQYFKGAVIEIDENMDAQDIVIILGKDEA